MPTSVPPVRVKLNIPVVVLTKPAPSPTLRWIDSEVNSPLNSAMMVEAWRLDAAKVIKKTKTDFIYLTLAAQGRFDTPLQYRKTLSTSITKSRIAGLPGTMLTLPI